jgi:hypothetical protein
MRPTVLSQLVQSSADVSKLFAARIASARRRAPLTFCRDRLTFSKSHADSSNE